MTARRRVQAMLSLAYLNGVIPIRTQPIYLVGLLSSPLSFLFFITIITHGAGFLAGVAGGLLLTIMSNGTGLQTDMSHYRQDLKWQDVVVASPVEAPTYVAGMALSELLYSVPGLAFFVALWAVYGGVSMWGAITVVGVLLMVWAFASALGFTLATYFRDVRETFAISPLISVILTVIAPVYYPVSALPVSVRPFAYISPTTYAADLMRSGFGLESLPVEARLVDWTVLAVFSVALVLISAWKARWRDP